VSANPCGCDPEAGHECVTHRIQHLEELVQVLQDDLAETRKDRDDYKRLYHAATAPSIYARPEGL